MYPLPEATLPECVISESGENYRGTQWVTGDGDACMPWNVSSVRKVSLEFSMGSVKYITTTQPRVQGGGVIDPLRRFLITYQLHLFNRVETKMLFRPSHKMKSWLRALDRHF